MGIIFAFIFAIVFFSMNNFLPTLYMDINDINNFDDNQAVLVIASKLLLIAAMFQISDSIQVVILGALRGLQDVRIPTIITFVSYWLIGFPVSYYLGDDRIFGSIGIWIGLLAGLTASSIFLYFRFDYLSKQFISKKSK
jgi:MATE family multidrug resistance protein